MSKSRTRTLLLSIMTLCIATAIVVGSSFALFSDTVPVNNHLVAGNLEVGLKCISFQEHSLATDGTMKTYPKEDKDIDLTATAAKLFEIEKAVPTSWYTAEIEVSNIGSTAFDYTLKILWNEDGKADAKSIAFAEQMEITVASAKLGSEPVVFKLSEAKDNVVKLGYLLKGTPADTFTVTAKFLDDEKNNSAMLATLDFDIQIEAVQRVEPVA